ncbi:glycolipid transfer protein 3-like [Tasmannia lanceolata]|uniref:glycolipid transfer protein 3-like n=1 Tax=Tasmannia lanceolata TaxID=3420 RepID=UPI0040645B3F
MIDVMRDVPPLLCLFLSRNIRQTLFYNQRLEKIYEVDPSLYSNLVEIVKKEVNEGSARTAASCSRALVWLTRAMDFTVALLDKLAEDPGQSLAQVVESSYTKTLKPWHGWISSAAYKVALQLVPENKTFISLLLAEGEEYSMLNEEIRNFVSLLLPLLNEIHAFLRTFRLDKLKTL